MAMLAMLRIFKSCIYFGFPFKNNILMNMQHAGSVALVVCPPLRYLSTQAND